MKELDMIRLNDISDEPSAELNARTLAAMRAAEEKKTQRKVPAWRKIAVCAAMFCAALVLMGAGVRVFEYLTYVPGMGIVTADQAEVYTLEHVVKAGGYRIEAVSMIPADTPDHKGEWQVTVLTNMEVPQGFHENPALVKPMVLAAEDGDVSLTCSGGSGIGARFTGYIKEAGEGEHTLRWFGKDHVITMKSMENSVWANYSYPVDQGMTVIAFPLAEGSRFMVFDVILDPESENMAYWASHSESIWYTPSRITITDTDGNTYIAPNTSGSSVSIPESELKYGVNSLLTYKMETILTLERELKAPIARIELGRIELKFQGISGTGFYTVTVPELDEVIDGADLPNGGVFHDSHGVKVQFDSLTSWVYEGDNSYEIWFTGEYPTMSFEENVVKAWVIPAYIRPDDIGTAKDWEYYRGSAGNVYNEEEKVGVDFNFQKDITGYGDRKIRTGTIDVTFGDEIAMCIDGLNLTVEGNWIIDFTAPAETAE